jgi:hypothetical protein
MARILTGDSAYDLIVNGAAVHIEPGGLIPLPDYIAVGCPTAPADENGNPLEAEVDNSAAGDPPADNSAGDPPADTTTTDPAPADPAPLTRKGRANSTNSTLEV